MNPTAQTGARGEALAAEYYKANGYTLLAANYHCRQGELDLVLQKDDTYVFCEVKTRSHTSLALPREWVTPKKQQRVIMAAQTWLQNQNLADVPCRFDVVEVIFQKDGSHTLNCIENAFP